MWFTWKEVRIGSKYSRFGATTAVALVPASSVGVVFFGPFGGSSGFQEADSVTGLLDPRSLTQT
jgi:hypothetical protein